MDAANKEIISLWVGKQSQKAAFSFYNLQAEQLFSEEEDPISQSCIWRNINKMQPRMIVFDTKIDRLATVREVSNKKILQKMKQQQGMNSLMGIFAHIDMKPLQKHEQQEETLDPQFSNWTDSEQNYKIVDQGYISLPTSSKQNPDIQLQRYLTFQEFYKINKEACQNKLRKQMERTDFLKVFTICTDETYSGFTAKTIEYLRQECPKKCYLLTSLSSVDNLPVVSLPKLYDEVDIYLPINTNCIKYKYFQNSTFSKDFAPLFSSLLTPLALKQSDPFDYLSTIMSDNRKLFNSAFTLPVIDTDLNLSKSTSIFRFQQASIKQFKKKIKLTSKQITDQFLGQKPKIKQAQVEEDQARINIANQSFLSIGDQKASGKFLSESYVLKGHFNSLEKLFQPKSQPASLSIKCLQGIFSANQQIAQVYDPFYKPYYDEKVEAYPYHLVMFSHQKFGSSMRSNLKLAQKTKIFNEQWPQCIEKVLHIADSYLELHQESD